MAYLPPETEGLSDMLRRFGAELRRCRYRAGMSQMQLAEHSGVSQSTISRLERGLAPAASTMKLVLLSEILGRRFPLGFCPHDHECNWQRLDEDGQPVPSQSISMADTRLRIICPELFRDASDGDPADDRTTPEHDQHGSVDAEAMPRSDWDMSVLD